MSVNSKSMGKISDNASDGSFTHQNSNEIGGSYIKKKKKNAYINMKKGLLATQTFNTDFEDNISNSVGGGSGKNYHHNNSVLQKGMLPPIF